MKPKLLLLLALMSGLPSLAPAAIIESRTLSGVVRRIERSVIYVQTKKGVEIVPKALLPKGAQPKAEEWIKIKVTLTNESKVKRMPARAGGGLRMW